jgi:hypothetical protein
MAVATKLPVAEPPRGELEAPVERLLAENAALKRALAESAPRSRGRRG